METFSALLALCLGNSLVTVEFPSQTPVTSSFDVFFDLCANKRLTKQSRHWWSEMPSSSLWRHYYDTGQPVSTLGTGVHFIEEFKLCEIDFAVMHFLATHLLHIFAQEKNSIVIAHANICSDLYIETWKIAWLLRIWITMEEILWNVTRIHE